MEIYVIYNVFFIKLYFLLYKVNWNIKFVGMFIILDRIVDLGNVKQKFNYMEIDIFYVIYKLINYIGM